MRKTFITLSLLFIVNLFVRSEGVAEITYIGNEGFMISNNGKKVLIDALYYYGNAVILDSDDSTRSMIINNTWPTSNSQLSLITHSHGDHYNKSMVSSYLNNNSQSKLVTVSGIISDLVKTNNAEQLIGISPQKYEFVDTIVNEIPLTVYNMFHDKTYSSYNVGFFANIGGLKIFHGGDNSIDDTVEYQKFKLNEKDIDVLFLWNFGKANWKDKKDFIKKYINPKYIVLMHNQPSEVPAIIEQVKNETNAICPIVVFKASMEKIQVTDTITFVNNMPVNIGRMTDTSFMINAPFDIDVPKLFEDKDANDSLTYFVSGLPKGVGFDKQAMKITGSAEKAGKYTIKVAVKDKNLCANSVGFKLTINDPNTAINSSEMKSFSIFPNPAADRVYISHLNNLKTQVMIYDLNGKLVLNKCLNDNMLDVSALSKGIYTVRIANSGNTQTLKLVKE